MINFLTGFALATAISLLAYRIRSLDRGGALAAVLLGTVVFGAGGLAWAILLVAFFASSSLLSHLFAPSKRSITQYFSKDSRRDAVQVFANGGAAGVFSLLHLIFPAQAWTWFAFAGALAAVNADTWGTEVGVLSRSKPRSILTGQSVVPGTSGGITSAGTLASLAGSSFIAALAVLLAPPAAAGMPVYFLIVSFAGLAGSLLDSALGAAFQAVYFCPACAKETELYPRHHCGSSTTLIRGVAWLGNDLVNVACSLMGALLSIILFVF